MWENRYLNEVALHLTPSALLQETFSCVALVI